MRTTKPIATISYNSPGFLRLKLTELTKAKCISFWAFIYHEPEDDEGGNKTHAHVYVEPSKMLQTDDLRTELLELDPVKPDKPLGCISWRSSKFGDWYLYALHDKRYLASKGQSRRYHYVHEDIDTSDDDDLLCKSKSIDLLSISPYEDMLNAIENGVTWTEYFRRGYVPLGQITNFQIAYGLLMSHTTYRGDGEAHD